MAVSRLTVSSCWSESAPVGRLVSRVEDTIDEELQHADKIHQIGPTRNEAASLDQNRYGYIADIRCFAVTAVTVRAELLQSNERHDPTAVSPSANAPTSSSAAFPLSPKLIGVSSTPSGDAKARITASVMKTTRPRPDCKCRTHQAKRDESRCRCNPLWQFSRCLNASVAVADYGVGRPEQWVGVRKNGFALIADEPRPIE